MWCIQNDRFQEVGGGVIQWKVFFCHDHTRPCHQRKSEAQPCSFYPGSCRGFAVLARCLLFTECLLGEEQKTWILFLVIPFKKIHAAFLFLLFLLILLIAVGCTQFAPGQAKETEAQYVGDIQMVFRAQHLAYLIQFECTHLFDDVADEVECLMRKEETRVEEEVFVTTHEGGKESMTTGSQNLTLESWHR